MMEFRKVAMLTGLTFEQEALARKLLGAVLVFQRDRKVDIEKGLLPFPEETITLFKDYADDGMIDHNRIINLLKTFIPGGGNVAQELLAAWEVSQSEIRRSYGHDVN
ncbi:hypothetical protein FQV43_00560 [Corynebacterium sp. sy039]|nr:hypothetical protein FQV43_00560 [Corynebacterium sp. sy039]